MPRWKVFGRARLIAEIAPRLYGHPSELDLVVDRILASELVVPLVGIADVRWVSKDCGHWDPYVNVVHRIRPDDPLPRQHRVPDLPDRLRIP